MTFVRIVFSYIVFFIIAMVLVVTALKSWSDGLQALFAFVTPAILVWWRERRRSQKLEALDKIGYEINSAIATDANKNKILVTQQQGADSNFRQKQSYAETPTTAKPSKSDLGDAVKHHGANEQIPSKVSSRINGAAATGKASEVRRKAHQQGWVAKNENSTVAGREIGDMVYVGTPPRTNSYGYDDKCKPYIDPSLSVASSGSDKSGMHMPYWPGYSEIPSVCRATYLDWLAAGRSDASIDPGYMFMYFYGLERRFLLDQPPEEEKREILDEVVRLRDLFQDNHSAGRYLGEFIDIARLSLNDPEVKKPVFDRRTWDLPLSVKVMLGGTIATGQPIEAEWLLSWFLCHSDKRLRTPAERCEEEFHALFKDKFNDSYPEGLKVRKPRKVLEYNYRAASGEFDGKIDLSANDNPILDISGLHKPIEIAQEIADEAMDDLDKFSRYLGRSPEGRGSLEGQALLPSELWELFPSNELEDLKDWATEKVAAGGLVLTADAIARLEGDKPAKISKRQLTGAADALARIGFGMAPDPRFSLRGPKIDEPVVIFWLGAVVEKLEDVSQSYRAALTEIALATLIAHADNQIVDAERHALLYQITNAADLSELERKRLGANLEWYLAVPPNISLLRGKLKEADAEQHIALRALVVGIAHADGIIQTEEVSSIEKVYKALGLDPALVYSDLHAGDVPDGPVRVKPAEAGAQGEEIPEEVTPTAKPLDAARIAAIRSSTKRVSSVLGDIFSADGEPEDQQDTLVASTSTIPGLNKKHALLIREIVEREHWSEDEFGALTKKYDLMTSGALETLNEWAFDNYDEALLDEYNGYDVASDIAEALNIQFEKESQ